jgi:hypothetical protein
MNMMRRFKKTVLTGDFLRSSLGNNAFGKMVIARENYINAEFEPVTREGRE